MTTLLLIDNIIFYIFLSATVIQIIYFLYFYSRVIFYKSKSTAIQANLPAVSVIIAAKNESKNLENNLSYFLEQDYPDYTVIVVNDASTDNSATVLAQLSIKYPNLYVTNIQENSIFKHGKKMALSIGIKAAKTDILLFSDADCRPVSKNWIRSIVKEFDAQTEIVIGYGAYAKTSGLLNAFIMNDTNAIALNYLGFGLAKIPYMGVGRNMAYRKSFFNQSKGFSKHLRLLSGSDDLFINQNATNRNTKVALSAESYTVSETKKTFKDWKNQKQRHLTTGKYYKFLHKFLLSIEPTTRMIYYLLSIYLLTSKFLFFIVLSLFIFRLIIFCFTLYHGNKKFNQSKIFISGLLFDILQVPLNIYFYIYSRKTKKATWR